MLFFLLGGRGEELEYKLLKRCVTTCCLRSKRFLGKFRCFNRAKVGARGFFAHSFFCSRPNFRAAKTSKFAKETLATQAK